MSQTYLIEQMILDGASMEQVIEAIEQLDERSYLVPEEIAEPETVPEGYIKRGGKKYLARRSVGFLEPVPEKDAKNAFAVAETTVNSEVAAMSALLNINQKSANWEAVDCPSLLNVLREQNARIAANDLAPAESMLMNNAVVLEQAFTTLMARAFSNSGQAMENYMRLALRCQNQARASLETLGRLKNPTVITRQMNVSGGHQQVNNLDTPAGGINPAERTIGNGLDT